MRAGGAATGAGHYAPVALLAVVPATVVLVWTQNYLPLSAPVFAAVALMAVAVLAWVAMLRHDRTLCERCARALPLSPEAHAARLRRRLWAAHLAYRPLVTIVYLAVLLGSDFLTGTLTGRIGYSIAQASLVYLVLAHVSHRRLQPWCPECREGGTPLRDVAPSRPTPVGLPG